MTGHTLVLTEEQAEILLRLFDGPALVLTERERQNLLRRGLIDDVQYGTATYRITQRGIYALEQATEQP